MSEENVERATVNPAPDLSPGRRAWRRFCRHRIAVASLVFLAIVPGFVFLYPAVSAYRPEQVSDAQFQPPGAAHWLGTDVHGRDMLVRLCHGAQISLLVGLVGAVLSLVIGVL